MSTAENQYTPVIAVDFDGTVVDHDFPRIGKLKKGAKETLNEWYEKGYHVIIWTCRNNFEPDHCDDPNWANAPIGAVVNFLREQGVNFTGVNQQQPGLGFYLESRKIFANVYIDDRNMGGFPGWDFTKMVVDQYVREGMREWGHYGSDLFNNELHGE